MMKTVDSYSVVLSVVLLVSVICYAWAIKKHFTAHSGTMDPKMRGLALVGSVTLAVHLFCLLSSHVRPLAFWSGLVLGVVALTIFALAIRSTRNAGFALAFSKEQPQFLVTSGPYAWLRHPFYTAYSLTWLMCVVSTLHIAAIISTAVMLCFYVNAAWSEEKLILNGPSRSTYLNYRSKVGMFWPRLR